MFHSQAWSKVFNKTRLHFGSTVSDITKTFRTAVGATVVVVLFSSDSLFVGQLSEFTSKGFVNIVHSIMHATHVKIIVCKFFWSAPFYDPGFAADDFIISNHCPLLAKRMEHSLEFLHQSVYCIVIYCWCWQLWTVSNVGLSDQISIYKFCMVDCPSRYGLCRFYRSAGQMF